MKHPAASLIVHVPFGQVLGVSTRSAAEGDRIYLKDLLDDAHRRALKAYRNEVTKRPEDLDEELVAESVGLGAIFFSYLSRTNIKDFRFDWEEALNFHGDTGPYLQYALARLYSIAAKAKAEGITPATTLHPEVLEDDASWRILSYLSRFDEVLERAATEYEPCHLANYLLELAKSFSSAYKTMRVVGEENEAIAQTRLAIFEALRITLHTGLALLGVPPLERM